MHESPNSIWFSKRFLVAIVIFLCFVNNSMLVSNMSIAVIEMTSNKTITFAGHTSVIRMAEFQWDTVTIGTVSSIVWYGGLFVFSVKYFVDKFGGSGTCVICSMMSGALTVLHPVVLKYDYIAFLVCRILTGIFMNLFIASTSEVYSRWFPKKERSTLIAICFNGMNVGTAIALPLFGYIAEKFGWQMVFYVSGTISVFISILCLVVVKNQPSQDKWISQAELSYILKGIDDVSRKQESHPYKKILLSGPVFALCVGEFTLMWAVAILTWCLPLYIRDQTDKSTEEVGLISSIPAITQIFIFPIVGLLLDKWKNSTSIKLTVIHKITISIAYLSSSFLFIMVVLLSHFTISMISFAIIRLMTSLVPAAFEPIIVAISPNDASVISGLIRFLMFAAVIVSTTCLGFMTINHTLQEWNNCFILAAGVLIIGAVIFNVLGSSEAQPWSVPDQERERLIKANQKQKFTDS